MKTIKTMQREVALDSKVFDQGANRTLAIMFDGKRLHIRAIGLRGSRTITWSAVYDRLAAIAANAVITPTGRRRET